jgi:hypothetical protein
MSGVRALRLQLRRAAPNARCALPYVFTAACFVLSRHIYRQTYGVRLDSSPVDLFLQYIDPWFMKHDLWRSLLYLHHQAPLQNLLVALPLKFWETDRAYWVLDVVYVALGLTTVLALLHAMLRLGARPLVAAFVSSLYAINPTTVLYENWLFYHLPVTCCLILSLVALMRYHRHGTFASALLFFGTITIAALFRSTLSPIFLSMVVLLLLLRPATLTRPAHSARWLVLRAAALPLLILSLNAARPSLLIGYGYGEALAAGNLVSKIFVELPPVERQRLVSEKLVSPLVTTFCLADLRDFGQYRMAHPPTGVPLLDMERAPDGRGNAHALEYLQIARKYYEPDAMYLLKHEPGTYLKAVGRAFQRYTAACTTDMWLPQSRNFARLEEWVRRVDGWFLPQAWGGLLVLSIALPLLAVFGIYRVLSANDRSYSQRGQQLGIAYMLLTIVYVTLLTTMVSFGDFSRYRYDLDPFYMTLLSLMLSELLSTVRKLQQRLSPAGPWRPRLQRWLAP